MHSLTPPNFALFSSSFVVLSNGFVTCCIMMLTSIPVNMDSIPAFTCVWLLNAFLFCIGFPFHLLCFPPSSMISRIMLVSITALSACYFIVAKVVPADEIAEFVPSLICFKLSLVCHINDILSLYATP